MTDNKTPKEDKKTALQPLTKKGNAPVPLSLLDFAVTGQGYSAIETLQNSIELAKLADRRGFARYWVAEHHSMPAISVTSPAVMLSRLIGETKQIRLGAGGMMLPNFPPLVVAEQFGMLEAMAPGRIDLGIGRAPGTDSYTATALRRGLAIGAENYTEQLEELFHFLDDDFPEDDPYKDKVWAVPGLGQDRQNGIPRSLNRPSVWLLGSSGYSAQLAGKRGLPFAFAAQLAPENLLMAFDLYRKNFQPSEVLDKPHTLACFGVYAAETEKEALLQTESFAHSMMRMMQGLSYLMPSPEDLAKYPYSAQERQIMEGWRHRMYYGTGETVAKSLDEIQKRSGADELMVVNLGHAPKGIIRSAELIADAYQMP
ncbi:LLM class flavin-dependent oxidoreductase [Pontibacter virosus]|uniref:Luciferase-like monooxygenase n=1 Tax=Pontibacter virosus TaxID=1765052 RepID=A0A2U1B119_9BACT|nr:LLM class flavin-dependent oxidoreductase [Pontibacter virosus]PVY42380.1 luciferase family oxidoreductase group 1 [Pontibacter virosus]